MLKGYRSALVGTTSVVALALASAMPAAAQQAQQAQGIVGLEEITVTARRVEENIQRVPIAIQAFTPERLEQQEIRDIWSLTKNIAGLNICCSPGNVSFMFMRGIGNGTPTYFGDIPIGGGGFASFFDVANVQVLKGPQGTLFGEASNAGAIVYEPRKPGEVFGGYASVSAGNYGRRTLEGAVDVPIVDDTVLFRMAAQTFHRGGYVTDITNNIKHGSQEYYTIRPSLTIRPMENLEIYTLYQFNKNSGIGVPFVLEDFNFSPQYAINFTTSQLNALAGLIPASYFAHPDVASQPAALQPFAAFQLLKGDVLAEQLALGRYAFNGWSTGCNRDPAAGGPILTGSCPGGWTAAHQIINHITFNVTDNITVRNIFGYRWGKSYGTPGDTDGTRIKLFDGGSPRNLGSNKTSPTWSDEIQVIANDLFGLLDLQVGTFHTATRNHPNLTFGRTLGQDILPTASISKNHSRSRAVYAQGNFDLGQFVDGLSATAGYRYTWDRSVQQSWTVNPNTLVNTARSGGPGTPTGDGRWKSGSYTFGLQYQWTPDIMFFVTNAKGFSTGGLQNVFSQEKYEPDSLNNIEVGTKATFNVGDVLLRTNVSYFHGWFNDVKVNVTKLANQASNPPPAPQSLIVVTENAAKAKIEGVEADLTVVPVEWLEVGGLLAYTKTNYTTWPSFIPNPTPGGAPIAVDLANTPFSFTPKMKWTLRGTYKFPIDRSWGDVSMTANFTRTGNMYNGARPFEPTDPNNPNTGIVCFRDRLQGAPWFYPAAVADGERVFIHCVPPHSNLDMSLDWRNVNGVDGLSATLSVTNVTKNDVGEGGCYCESALGVNSPAPPPPRMFSLRLRYNF
jgi:iron complex outermembrane receptor protein